MKRNPFLIVAAALLLYPLTLVAQLTQNENLANSVLAVRTKEAAMLQQYNWNCRTEILQNQAVQDIRIDLVNVGPDGQLQRSLLNDTPGQLPGGFFRKAIEENRRKELEKYIADLSKLADQYTLPSAGKVVAFLVQAQVQPITTPAGKTALQVTGANVVVPGDTFTLTLDGQTMQTTGIQISTFYNGDPVTIQASFVVNKTGPNHLQYATVTVPNKNVTVMIHNYDYFLMN